MPWVNFSEQLSLGRCAEPPGGMRFVELKARQLSPAVRGADTQTHRLSLISSKAGICSSYELFVMIMNVATPVKLKSFCLNYLRQHSFYLSAIADVKLPIIISFMQL